MSALKRSLLVLLALLLVSTAAVAVTANSSMKIFAVTTEGEGLAADLELKVIPGEGQVWTSVHPLVGTSTQSAAQVAVDVARGYEEGSDSYDFLYQITSDATLVEGPSAGGAMALMAVAALKNQRLPAHVSMTGTISSDGSIGPVGGVFEKAREAAKVGIKLFLIPAGEAKQVVKLPNSVESIDLSEYALTEWGIKVVEVKTLDEAYALAFSDIEDIDVEQQAAERLPVFVPAPIRHAEELGPLAQINDQYLDESAHWVTRAKNSLSTTLLSDNAVINRLLSTLGDIEDVQDDAEQQFESNYLYSAANSGFLVRVNAGLIYDISENPSLLTENATAFSLKLDELDERLSDLENRLDGAVPTDSFEWFAAAQQRASWARISLSSARGEGESVIVVNGNGEVDATSHLLSRIEDYEFALGWTEIAERFYDIGMTSEKKVLLGNTLKEESERAIIAAENLFTSTGDDPGEDMARRVNSARLGDQRRWFLQSVYDAHSAEYLLRGEEFVREKSPEELQAYLGERIPALDSRIAAHDGDVVWANLYLDHARYYYQAAEFYFSTDQGARANDMLHSGVVILFLAEGNLEAAQKVQAAMDAFGEADYVADSPTIRAPATGPGGTSATIRVEPAENPLYWVFLALLAACIALIVAIMAAAAYTRHQFAARKRRLEKVLSAGGKHSVFPSPVLARAEERARRVVSLDDLHAKLELLEHDARVIRRRYSAGTASDSDFERYMTHVRQQVKNLFASPVSGKGDLGKTSARAEAREKEKSAKRPPAPSRPLRKDRKGAQKKGASQKSRKDAKEKKKKKRAPSLGSNRRR